MDEKRGDNLRTDLNDRAAKERARRNRELCNKVKSGEIIEPTVSMMDIWFPPRPKIKKDKKLVSQLYGESDEEVPKRKKKKGKLKLL